MKNTRMSRSELSEMLLRRSEEKMSEREALLSRALEEPGRSDELERIAGWLDLDIRYHRLASVYYSDDYSVLADGSQDDLLTLLDSSGLPERSYAEYLRLIPPGSRDDEKVTHAAVEGFKEAMRDTMGGFR